MKTMASVSDLELAFDVGHSSIGWAVLQSSAGVSPVFDSASKIRLQKGKPTKVAFAGFFRNAFYTGRVTLSRAARIMQFCDRSRAALFNFGYWHCCQSLIPKNDLHNQPLTTRKIWAIF